MTEDMDTLRDKLNETSGLAKLLFEQQFIRHGGRKPADPEWSDLDESERDEWWDRALDAGPLIEGERSSRQAWAEEADEWTQNAQEWYEASEKLLHDYNSLVLELGNEWPKARRQQFLAFVEARHPYVARPLKLDALPSDLTFDDLRKFPRRFCACVPDEQAAALVEAGFTRPQCTVHPDGPVIDMGYMSMPKEFHDAVESAVDPDLATPDEWSQRLGIRIVDPDGWRNDGKAWDAPISRGEFEARAAVSTCGPLVPGGEQT